LKQNARALCPKALERAKDLMNHEDGRISLAAIELILAYGYGRPVQEAVVDMNHNFCVAPETMQLDEWLSRRGQPRTPEGDKWLLENMARVEAEKRTGGLPTGTGEAVSRPTTIDLEAEDPLLTAVDPTEPPAPGTKLN
jgi:hypothetical protein